MISGLTLGEGSPALTLSKRAPVPRAARASISHGRRTSGTNETRSREVALETRTRAFPPVFPLPQTYFRPPAPRPQPQPISVTWLKCVSKGFLGYADLEKARGWNLFWFSLMEPEIPDMVTKEAIFHVQLAQKHLPPSSLPPSETQFTLPSI